jgi:lipopolysaccharide assembly outer membrane protein LptD (OstA)
MPRRSHIVLFLSPFLFLSFSSATAQIRDTSAVRDTAAFRPDTTATAGVDTVVAYSARDSIVYSMRTRLMNLYGEGQTAYQTMSLKAERIGVNWDTATLVASGIQDSVKADSVVGKPVIRDAGEEYRGDTVAYHFRTRKGRIALGKTEIEEGYYTGESIKKVDVNVLYVADGRYTTCDLEHPHFYFTSPRMKLFVRDKVVVEPVYFYVADVPVFALPFGVFPSRGGRASGIIAPAFGEDNRTGSYLSHFGYYWAVSDYVDLATAFDLTTRGGWANRSRFNYALRYDFTGTLDGEYRKVIVGESGDPDYQSTDAYDISLRHNQVIDPSSRIDVNFRFSSGNFRDYSRSIQDILAQNIFSAASYTETWDRSNRSLAVSITRDQSLTNGDVREVLPSLSFSQSQIFPFRPRTRSRGYSAGSDVDRPWIEMLGMNYGASFLNQRTKISTPLDSLFRNGQYAPVTEFRKGTSQSLSQNLGFSISPKVGFVTITPALSFNDSRTWQTDRVPFRDPADSTLGIRDDYRQNIRGNVSTGVSASTRFYGLAQPGLFGVQALRHTVNPTLALTYNKQVYGQNMPKYQMLGSFNVANNFEMKYNPADTGEGQKVQLMNLGLGFSYDFARDSLRFSEVGINVRTDVGQFLSISGGVSYNLYQFDRVARTRVNKFLLSEEGRFGDLTSVSLSLSTSLRGEKKQAAKAEQGLPKDVLDAQKKLEGPPPVPSPRPSYQTIYDREDADFSIPWNITLSYTFSQSRQDPTFTFRTSSANANLSFNLTEQWQVGTSASYDFVNKEHFIPSVDVTRDLHCWTMKFTWYPMGIREGYRLELRVKAPQLQDIKVTKQNSQRGIYY